MKLNITQHHGSFQFDIPSYPLEEADAVLMWADFPFSDMVRQFRKAGKKIVTYEHGRNALWDYYLNDRPLISDAYIAWGKSGKDAIEEACLQQGLDIPVCVAGNPIFNDLRQKKTPRRKEYLNVLYVAMHWVRDVTGYNSKYLLELKQCLNECDNLTVKVIEKSGVQIPEGVETWSTEVGNNDSLKEIVDKIKDFDLIATPKESTFELAARFAGIPVVELDVYDEYAMPGEPTNYSRTWSNMYKLDRLQEAIYRAREGTLYMPSLEEIEYECKRPSMTEDELIKFIEGL